VRIGSDPESALPTWLPDFCRRKRLLAMLAIAELVVVLVFLAPGNVDEITLQGFLSASAFALWLGFAVSALLCISRRYLSSLPMRLGYSLAVLGSGLVTLVAAGVVYGLFAVAGQSPAQISAGRFVLGSTGTSMLITAMAMRYFHVSDHWIAQLKANARAEADALQARIRPHFLFNSMNLIAALVRRDPIVAERAVLDLSDLFRAALGAGDKLSTLREEVDLARSYLSIESLRLGSKLDVQWILHEPLPWSLPLPGLVLQPLVENAVLHGISQLTEGGVVEVEIRCDDRDLAIRIENPTPPPGEQGRSIQGGAGHAQQSIAYRLAYRFGSKASLRAEWRKTYRCDLVIPIN
jgi:two-component system, LytTR family, sensor histidine kinase AlgZ